MRVFVAVVSLAMWAVVVTAPAARANGNPPPPYPISDHPRPPKVSEPDLSTLGLYLEEDKFLLSGNQDRNYTGGGALYVSGGFLHSYHVDAPLRLVDWLLFLPRYLHRRNHVDEHALMLGLTVFTPGDLASPVPVVNDRPYASLLFLNWSHMSVNHSDTVAVSSELTLGLLGLGIGGAVQNGIHGVLGIDKAQGWSHEISHNGEPTARYALGVQYRPPVFDWRWGDVVVAGKAEAGYYMALSAGPSVRVGCINTEPWDVSDNPLRGGNQARPHCPYHAHRFELYGWAQGRGRLVGYNALLEGQFRHSDYAFSNSQIRHALLEFATGVTLGISNFRLTWTIIAGRSPEFSGPLSRTHTWAGVFAGYSKPFGMPY